MQACTSCGAPATPMYRKSTSPQKQGQGAGGVTFHMQGAKPGARWQKVMFVRQPYADNHVDETFLASLVTNANVQPYQFWHMVRSTMVVIQQISVMAIFFLSFSFVHSASVSISTIVVVDILTFLTLLVLQRLAGPMFALADLVPDLAWILKHVAIFLAVIFALAPILQTLTQSYCNDTIWALTILLATLHIAFHEYHVTLRIGGLDSGSREDSRTAAFPGTISLNAAMFAAVLLASRLPTPTHVFIFILLAIQLFALFPLLRDYIRVRSEPAHLALTALLFAVTVLLLLLSSTLLAVVYVCGAGFIAFVAPLWLQSVQKYKNEIHGPWDIATVQQFST